jgi:hypothetical protein
MDGSINGQVDNYPIVNAKLHYSYVSFMFSVVYVDIWSLCLSMDSDMETEFGIAERGDVQIPVIALRSHRAQRLGFGTYDSACVGATIRRTHRNVDFQALFLPGRTCGMFCSTAPSPSGPTRIGEIPVREEDPQLSQGVRNVLIE